MDLTKLLKPSSIAVIGATTRPNMAGRATASVVKSRISDRVYYVNPNRDEVDGRKCYKSLCELPEIVDQLLICTPAEAVAKILEEGGQESRVQSYWQVVSKRRKHQKHSEEPRN